MAISATDATDRVEQLIVLTERLTELIAHEALAFEERRPQDAALHIEETSKLANVYRHESARVRANPNLVAGAPLVQRTRLIRATEAFDAVRVPRIDAFEKEHLLFETQLRDETGRHRGGGTHQRTPRTKLVVTPVPIAISAPVRKSAV